VAADMSQRLAHLSERLSPELAAAIPSLLAEAPDPDSALVMFERLTDRGEEVLGLLRRHHFLAHYAVVVFGNSRYLGETLLHDPDLLQSLSERNLNRGLSHEELAASLAQFRSRCPETEVSLLLAHFKRREYVRIMLRDCLKYAPVAETTAEISALADVLIQDALREAESQFESRYGPPRHRDSEGRLVSTPFTVLSLGKLGGYELNYSSDVDLLYLFGEGEELPDAKISNHEYFIRLAQQLTQILSRVTESGPVFRIDMRLRPQGTQGELAVSLGHALRYYVETAQDWERQALIKARYTAGNRLLARTFLRGVQPHVYVECGEADSSSGRESSRQGYSDGRAPGPINFAAIETALQSRAKMHRRRPRLADGDTKPLDVKLDRGGIRDIEFLVQCLQRVYGGSEPWLRSRGTLFSLQKLHDKQHLNGKEFHELTTAYEFLRHVEHRLQLRDGQQRHHMPFAEADLQVLQRSLEGCLGGEDHISDIHETLRRRMAGVTEIYDRILHSQREGQVRHAADDEFELRNIVEPAADHAQRQLLERLSVDSPELHVIARRADLSMQARRNLFRFFSSALTSSQRYAAVLRYPQALEKALVLFEASEYLSEILVRHPEEIATLAELGQMSARVGSDYLFQRPLDTEPGDRLAVLDPDFPAAVSDPVLAYLAQAPNPHGEKVSLLRRHYRHRVFASGARDILELRDVYVSLGSTSAAAEDAIATAFAMSGTPGGLAVMALGRLGTAEFDVLSDADLLFVYEEGGDPVALTKFAERIMHILAAYTREGSVFPVDTRLRPRGHEGDLLQTPSQLKVYFQQEAQPWEAMTYTKLRYVGGSLSVAKRAVEATGTLFRRFAESSTFLPAVLDMRGKLEAAAAGEMNFKTSAGGIYDIDFLASYLLVKNDIRDKRGTLRERLWRCAAVGVLAKLDAGELDHAAELFRTVDHAIRLAVGRSRNRLPYSERAHEVTAKIASGVLGRNFPQGLDRELVKTCGQVREIYARILR
jgi:[glutamine synthetase] adenylyltransferase / [glutamine synthetase]-adenylyl-L-tyrosine phosphorylase